MEVFIIDGADPDQLLWFCCNKSPGGSPVPAKLSPTSCSALHQRVMLPVQWQRFPVWAQQNHLANQPTSQPATPFISCAKSGCCSCRWATLPVCGETEDPNIKKVLTEVWGIHAGSGVQLDPHRTYQPGGGRKEVCTCGPVVPLHTTPCLKNRYRAAWL